LPSVKFYTDKNGMISAKIQAYCRNAFNPDKLVFFYTRVYNEKHLPVDKFKKKMELYAVQFQTEQTLKYQQEAEPQLKERENQLAKIQEIRDIMDGKIPIEDETPTEEEKEEDGINYPDSETNFDGLAQEWLAHVLRDYSVGYYLRSKRTIELFNEFLQKKGLYEKQISEIKVRDIQMFLNTFQGQSVNTVRGHRRVLHVIFEDALRYEWVNRNPVNGIKLSAVEQNLRPVEEKEVFSMEETKQFVQILDDYPEEKRTYRAAFKIMLFAGLRSGETYGLKWSDVDLEKKTIHVRRNRLYSKVTNEYYEKCPKTYTSLRDVPIPDILYDELVDYKNWYKEKVPDLDEKLDLYYLVCNIHMKPAQARALQEEIVVLRKSHNFKKHITCHGLRHTYCSLLLTQSIPIQTVTRYMGHSNSTVTLRVYTHFIPDTQQIFLDTINKAFS